MDGGLRALRPYVLGILLLEVALVAAYAAFPDVTLLDLDKEYNLPSWFSALQLAAVGVACLVAFEGERRGAHGHPPLHRLWIPLALGFLYLSADEMLALHERVLTDALRRLLPADSLLQGVLPWQLIFAPAILAAFVVVSVMIYTRLGAHIGLTALGLAALCLWAASFVLEGAAKPLFIPARLYRLEVALEESAEMLGATCLLAAFASYAVRTFTGSTVPLRAVQWRRVAGAAGGLCAGTAAVIAAFTLSNPAYLYRRAGDKFVEKREYPRAIAAYERAISIRPADADIWRRLGQAAFRSRRYDVAAHAYREATSRAPGDAKLNVNLGVALHHAGDLDGAIAAYEAALRVDPEHARAHRNLGVAFERRGELAQAEAHYRLATRYDTRMADAFRYLGDLLERQGRLKEAREAWQKSIEADPDQREAPVLRRRIHSDEKLPESAD